MAGKIYIVEGRQFKSDAEYKQALKDQETIEKLREQMKSVDLSELKALSNALSKGKYKFATLLGDDFADELDEKIKSLDRRAKGGLKGETKSSSKRESVNSLKRESVNSSKNDAKPELELPRRRLADDKLERRRIVDDEDDEEVRPIRRGAGRYADAVRNLDDDDDDEKSVRRRSSEPVDEEIEAEARRILKRRERNRRIILILSIGIGLLSIAAFTFFKVTNSFTGNKALYQLREKAENEHGNGRGQNGSGASGGSGTDDAGDNNDVVIHYTDTNTIAPNVLPEFEEMLSINSKLIGWLTIDGTTIDYPVAQTTDNEYYLTHDLYQNYDRNGTIFLDCNCDVLKPSTNFILYGHHMQSGKMFGKLNKYEDEDYYKSHKYITFDTIYEYGTYQVMYVFRSHVFEETEIAFKYYQFTEAYSEVEFDSYMNEMASMSLYDTGVTAQYGDRLLTLSTCDYQEKNGRFVVVAKKIK